MGKGMILRTCQSWDARGCCRPGSKANSWGAERQVKRIECEIPRQIEKILPHHVHKHPGRDNFAGVRRPKQYLLRRTDRTRPMEPRVGHDFQHLGMLACDDSELSRDWCSAERVVYSELVVAVSESGTWEVESSSANYLRFESEPRTNPSGMCVIARRCSLWIYYFIANGFRHHSLGCAKRTRVSVGDKNLCVCPCVISITPSVNEPRAWHFDSGQST